MIVLKQSLSYFRFDSGTHHELMTLEDGLYHQLVSRQNLSSEESGDAVQEKINEKN